MVQGANEIAGRRLSPPGPLGGTRTVMTEPCGALPRNCLFNMRVRVPGEQMARQWLRAWISTGNLLRLPGGLYTKSFSKAHITHRECRAQIRTVGRARRTSSPHGADSCKCLFVYLLAPYCPIITLAGLNLIQHYRLK
jgi:hypothetical protein